MMALSEWRKQVALDKKYRDNLCQWKMWGVDFIGRIQGKAWFGQQSTPGLRIESREKKINEFLRQAIQSRSEIQIQTKEDTERGDLRIGTLCRAV